MCMPVMQITYVMLKDRAVVVFDLEQCSSTFTTPPPQMMNLLVSNSLYFDR
jgi:hypothetical protein